MPRIQLLQQIQLSPLSLEAGMFVMDVLDQLVDFGMFCIDVAALAACRFKKRRIGFLVRS